MCLLLGACVGGPLVLLQCCQNAGWLEALTKCHDTLEVVGRALEDYFETKRLAFPR
jgi:hypothetical protein